ncbi:hypothetical protein DSL72_007295 [Monilinia vaccinii-corymbosi]|uniref:Phytocyanin domain-containing protein n=1 Tax=Monilinia vaccinii-corymbosi TaxID=61207 RepID=A0A8A3PM07_9HELO|nr:hypothetical protein DSL72_007295 [Monilinia vaccinii-corymbosi]
MQKSIIYLFALLSSALAATYSIAVGGSGLTFVRKSLHAQVGDQVQFIFSGKHSVAQSTFDNPCVPSDHAPIFSGVISASPNSIDAANPVWTMDLKTNKTLWLYCSVGDHCQKGMSMTIVVGNNPNPDETLDKYQAAAAKVAQASAPTETLGGTLVLPSGTSGSATATASGNFTATITALSTTVTSRASTVTATRSGSASGLASATSSGAGVTATGAAGQAQVPVALGLAGIAGGLAAFLV